MADDETPTTTSAAATLQQRLIALRSSGSSSASGPSAGTSLTSKLGDDVSKTKTEEDEDLFKLLASLEVPDHVQGDEEEDQAADRLEEDVDVPIQVKNVDEQVRHFSLIPALSHPKTSPLTPNLSLTCSKIMQYLTTASQLPSTSSLPPLSSSTSQKKLEATLGTYEALAPQFVSPIEVSFFTPSTDPTCGLGGVRGDDQEEALMARLRDELSVEKAVKNRKGDVEEGWEKKLNRMKEFRPVTDPEKEKEYMERVKGLGEGPGLEGVEELQKRRRGEKTKVRKGSGSEEDTESDSEEE